MNEVTVNLNGKDEYQVFSGKIDEDTLRGQIEFGIDKYLDGEV